MDGQVYIEQEIKGGCKAHYHDGVWWQSHVLGCCRPVLPFQQVTPGVAKPRYSKAYVAYNHLAPASVALSATASYYLLRGQRLREYSLDGLNDGKRRGIKKAQRAGLLILRISSLEPLWDDLQELAMSAHSRTGYGKGAEFYRTHFGKWQESMRREFAKPGREWWGAYHQEKLGAYMYGYLVDGTLHLANVKVHSDFIKLHASDLLLFSLVMHAKGLPQCSQVDVGRSSPDAPSVDRWKELHGFERVDFGECFVYRRPVSLAVQCLLLLDGWWKRLGGRFGGSNGSEPHGPECYRKAIEAAERIASRLKQPRCVTPQPASASHDAA